MKETRAISRPLIFERPEPWRPSVDYGGEPVAGLGGEKTLPPIRGFVMTTPKETAIIEVSSPLPAENQRNPILAHWQFGLGRAVAFTTDAGQRWSSDWASSEIFGKFWSQLVRWTMRPNQSDKLTLSTQEKDGMVRVVVSAADQNGQFINDLPMESSIVRPSGVSEPLVFKQTEPGKYEAQYAAEDAGTYVVRVAAMSGDGTRELAFSPHNVSYPPEYRETVSRRELVESISLASGGETKEWKDLPQANLFSEPSQPVRRRQDAWPLALLTALVLFLFDVAIRRISLDPREVSQWIERTWASLRGKNVAAPVATLDRLRSIKEEVSQELRQRRYSAGEKDGESTPISVMPASSKSTPTESAKPAGPLPGLVEDKSEDGDNSHTSRLLRAKKQVWEDRDKKKEDS